MMKRMLAILLAAVMVLSLVGCGQKSEDIPLLEDQVQEAAEEAQGIMSYQEIIQIADENHAPYTQSGAEAAMDLTPYAINDPALLTQAEIEALRTSRDVADGITLLQAQEDVDLFFRAWKYSYPAYYYMGEEVFVTAQAQVEAALEEYKDNLSGAELGNILYESMSFLQDDHSSINGKIPIEYENSLLYVAYLDNAQTFDKDENGYYQTFEGVRWYFSHADRSDITIVPTVLPSGKVVHCPQILVQKSESVSENHLFLSDGTTEKEIAVHWTLCENDPKFYDALNAPSQASVEVSEDILYLDQLTMDMSANDFDTYIQTAEQARNCRAIIFDLRHTGGGGHWQLVEWIKLLTGDTPTIYECELARNNALCSFKDHSGTTVPLGEETCQLTCHDGHRVANDIPLIILIDKSCGSAVEEALLYLKSVENSILIGANSKGCAISGSAQDYWLPHSGVTFGIGGFAKFQGEVRNIDGIGFEPDIWCEPTQAASSALKLLQYYGVLDAESIQPLYEQLLPPVDLRVVWHEHEVLPGQCFGDIVGENNFVDVVVDGSIVTDFTVVSEEPTKLGAERTKDGKVKLSKIDSFNGEMFPFTITYQGQDITFNCNDDT